MGGLRSGRTLSAAIVALLGLGCGDLSAQTIGPSAERGLSLAMRLCASCHVVDEATKSAVPVGLPSFRGIANAYGQTAERITNVLIRPHTPMPDTQLTRDEIEDLLAYLETLRTNPAVPPLMVPGIAKPEYPSKT